MNIHQCVSSTNCYKLSENHTHRREDLQTFPLLFSFNNFNYIVAGSVGFCVLVATWLSNISGNIRELEGTNLVILLDIVSRNSKDV